MERQMEPIQSEREASTLTPATLPWGRVDPPGSLSHSQRSTKSEVYHPGPRPRPTTQPPPPRSANQGPTAAAPPQPASAVPPGRSDAQPQSEGAPRAGTEPAARQQSEPASPAPGRASDPEGSRGSLDRTAAEEKRPAHPQLNKSQSLSSAFGLKDTSFFRSASEDVANGETLRSLRKSFASLFSD